MKASRLHTLALAATCLMVLASLAVGRRLTTDHSSRGVSPAGQLSELAIEEGESGCALGPPPAFQGQPGFGWANKLTPSTYPATLRTITVGFNRAAGLLGPDKLFRIVVFIDPEGDGPSNGQQPDASFIGRVRGLDTIQTFNLITPVRIQSGAFVVGVFDDFAVCSLDQTGAGTFPAVFSVPGKSNPRGSESFFTQDFGGAWGRMSDLSIGGQCGVPGSFLIRATVESSPAETLSATRIKDPAAVEPWAVSIFGGDALVANYVSDNLTVIKISDNSFVNVAVGDGPGGVPDGPSGIAVTTAFVSGVSTTRAYVSLFGSNTIPSKEFPIDYSTVGPGRVQVLTRSAATGAFTSVSQISVGKGPRFPAIASGAPSLPLKLYVPCAGANRVDVIDVASNTKIKEIAVGREPTSCTAGLASPKVYVTNFGEDTISVIDARTDQVVKTIRFPGVDPPPIAIAPLPPTLNPWNADVSRANGNLYVTYWGTPGNVGPNGGIAEFDTCRDEFLRLIIDDTTHGTPAGSAGASGIAAPTGPLILDPATGLTPGAGGGGGGPFGIAAGGAFDGTVLFTNDGAGTIGVIDTRVDQVVSAPPLSIASCPKPREAASATTGTNHVAYVACGQPDSSVIVVNIPRLRENLPNIPVPITAIFLDPTVVITGSEFTPGSHVELIVSGECIEFRKKAKIKKRGTQIVQKGVLSDGRSVDQVFGLSPILRVVTPEGAVRLVSCCGIP